MPEIHNLCCLLRIAKTMNTPLAIQKAMIQTNSNADVTLKLLLNIPDSTRLCNSLIGVRISGKLK